MNYIKKLTFALQPEIDLHRKKWQKIYVKLAKEMHERFPHYTISQCYELVKSRHVFNLKTKKEGSQCANTDAQTPTKAP